ncbi:hypothetical protein KY284_020312 [Solanum tuberosum]|nr:hypothetical protein KY284_020312 [Solanum tuberosum]
MKFMKLGSRPDTFFTTEAVRSLSSEISSDLIVQVKGSTYLLHKYAVQQNIYKMTEDVEKGNFICKLQVFLNSCLLSGWRDSIVTLQSTRSFPLWSEHLGITSTCIEAIASKVLANRIKMNLSRRDDVSCTGSQSLRHKNPLSKDWWAEDLAELSIDLYWRTMIAIKSGGRVPANFIGDALRIYASRWLPNISKSNSDSIGKHRLLLESITSLLPAERGAASCSFLLKLLKAANILKASSSSKMELKESVYAEC